jgi:hypothetical protein
MSHPTQRNLCGESRPLLAYLLGIGGFCLAFAGFLHWLLQPVVLPNPGLAAYRPPPGTRLEPMRRKSDAPELTFVIDASEAKGEIKEPAAAPAAEPHPPPKRARFTKTTNSERHEARSKPRKATRTVAGRAQPPAYVYAEQGNSWSRHSMSWGFW